MKDTIGEVTNALDGLNEMGKDSQERALVLSSLVSLKHLERWLYLTTAIIKIWERSDNAGQEGQD